MDCKTIKLTTTKKLNTNHRHLILKIPKTLPPQPPTKLTPNPSPNKKSNSRTPKANPVQQINWATSWTWSKPWAVTTLTQNISIPNRTPQ